MLPSADSTGAKNHARKPKGIPNSVRPENALDLKRWTLLRAGDDAARELAAALGVGYRPNGQGGFDHAAVISLLDEKGEIIFQQRGSQASSDELLARLRSLSRN